MVFGKELGRGFEQLNSASAVGFLSVPVPAVRHEFYLINKTPDSLWRTRVGSAPGPFPVCLEGSLPAS